MKRTIVILAALAVLSTAAAARADVTVSYHLAPNGSSGWHAHANAVNLIGQSRANPTTGYAPPIALADRLICQRADGSWYVVTSAKVFLDGGSWYERFAPASSPSWWLGGVYLGNFKYPGGCDNQARITSLDPIHDRVVYVTFDNAFNP